MKAILTFVDDNGESVDQIEFDATRKVPLFKAVKDGAAYLMPVGLERFNAKVFCHWLDYGIRQNLNDASSSVLTGSADAYERTIVLAEKRLTAFEAGEVRSNAGGVRVDAVAREAFDMAEADVRKWYKAAGKKLTGAEDAIEAIARDCVRDSLTPKGRHYDYMVNAKAIIELRRNRDDEDLDVTP